MTPKEKADELYEAFFYSIPSFTDEGQLEHKTAKQCALIAVDEIIESKKLEYLFTFQEITLLNFTKDDRLIHSKFINYWQEVKQEIEKL